jgi:glycosyltransferase involved in cell wall biosynthesis
MLRARADAVIVHGETLRRRYLESHEIDASRVHAIPHGCYELFRHWAHGDVVREPHTILFFGRIELYKGLTHLIEAFHIVRERCPQARLIVAGGGQDLERHRSVLDALPGCEVHAGYVPMEKVAALFQRAAVAVLPYVEGSQSGVTRIAYPFGLPVVVTNVGSIPESVLEGRTGLIVPPGDTAALASALTSVVTDAALRERLSAGAAEMAAGVMSWATVAARQEPVLRAASARQPDLAEHAR